MTYNYKDMTLEEIYRHMLIRELQREERAEREQLRSAIMEKIHRRDVAHIDEASSHTDELKTRSHTGHYNEIEDRLHTKHMTIQVIPMPDSVWKGGRLK